MNPQLLSRTGFQKADVAENPGIWETKKKSGFAFFHNIRREFTVKFI